MTGPRHLAEAKRMLDAGASLPITVQVAIAHALIAQAEAAHRQALALEHLVHKLDALTDDDAGQVLRISQVPR